MILYQVKVQKTHLRTFWMWQRCCSSRFTVNICFEFIIQYNPKMSTCTKALMYIYSKCCYIFLQKLLFRVLLQYFTFKTRFAFLSFFKVWSQSAQESNSLQEVTSQFKGNTGFHILSCMQQCLQAQFCLKVSCMVYITVWMTKKECADLCQHRVLNLWVHKTKICM